MLVFKIQSFKYRISCTIETENLKPDILSKIKLSFDLVHELDQKWSHKQLIVESHHFQIICDTTEMDSRARRKKKILLIANLLLTTICTLILRRCQ